MLWQRSGRKCVLWNLIHSAGTDGELGPTVRGPFFCFLGWLPLNATFSLRYLSGNDLTGTLPTELGLMQELDLLDVGQNFLTGQIPAEIVAMSSLKILWLSSNQLTGTISTEFGLLKNLESM